MIATRSIATLLAGKRAACQLSLAVCIVLIATSGVVSAQGGDLPPHGPSATLGPDQVDQRRAAVASYLRHIYSVYFGLRACTEIRARHNDNSFLSEVPLDEARRRLRLIDIAAGEIGIDAARIWAASAPIAEVTAEALKSEPSQYLERCQRMGSLFRIDAANLQMNLQAMGAKTELIPKDY